MGKPRRYQRGKRAPEARFARGTVRTCNMRADHMWRPEPLSNGGLG